MYDHPTVPKLDQSDTADCDRETTCISMNRRVLIGGAAGAIMSGCLTEDAAEARRVSDDQRISKIIGKMTTAEKAAQLFVIRAAGTSMASVFRDLLCDVQPGGVIFFAPNVGTADQLRTFVHDIHRTHRGIPPLVAVDQEGGPVVRIAGDPAPGAVALGIESDKTVRQKARQRAEFLAGFGFDVNFAPVADIAYKPTSFMASRSFGADPDLVAAKVHDFVRGSRAGGLAGAAKHFPGHGRTSLDSHVALPEVKLSVHGWKKTDSRPFAAAIEAGVEMVMIGHLLYPKWEDAPTSLSRVAVRTLREELDFGGVVVTDDLGMGALRGIDPFELVDRAIDAGVDLLLYSSLPVPIGDLVKHLRRRIERGDVSESRINASLRRILAMKASRFKIAADR
ncbi:MAG: beta-N-acetylhexosaminidase [Thermomicrobiales bacterium]|nr:beta-N-acetylhexosaminidase [Thermomicrobiales bacterium]